MVVYGRGRDFPQRCFLCAAKFKVFFYTLLAMSHVIFPRASCVAAWLLLLYLGGGVVGSWCCVACFVAVSIVVSFGRGALL